MKFSRQLWFNSLGIATGIYLARYIIRKDHEHLCEGPPQKEHLSTRKKCPIKKPLPPRPKQLENLQQGTFDVLVIGGGATGTGCALDAVTRGLKTALVEADDFASGTSSRSTKLIHGGVRYLQSAVLKLDKDQYYMVKEALRERSNVLEIAPHLSYQLPILLPMYKFWEIPMYWIGIKMYDMVAGRRILQRSYFLSKNKAIKVFPMLKKHKLKGAIVYFDGGMNDARLALALAVTAAHYGAAVANHTRVIKILHKPSEADEKTVVSGARVRDELTGDEFDICAKCVINATGPFTDSIRTMDNPTIKPICAPSSGVHITLPGYFCPASMGLLDASTSDNRVVFFLPWLNHTIAGTTDGPTSVTANPRPTEEEINFILKELKTIITNEIEIRRGDVLSAWSGIRPLVRDPLKTDTAKLVRNHIVEISPTNMITIAGGKWTTYRSMAEETVTKAINTCKLSPGNLNKCRTEGMKVEGAHNWSPNLFIRLVQDFGLDERVSKHLTSYYGDRAFCVAELAESTGRRWPVVGNRLHPDYPYINAEIRYACKEFACTAIDVIARRLNLSYLNSQVAYEVLPDVIDIMAIELDWGEFEKDKQYKSACKFLREQFALQAEPSQDPPKHLTPSEISFYSIRFNGMEGSPKGFVSVNDVKRNLKRYGDDIPKEQMSDILSKIDPKRNGLLDMSEYLQLMFAIKYGLHGSRGLDKLTAEKIHKKNESGIKFVSVDRSCGDL